MSTENTKDWRKKSMRWGKRLLLTLIILGGAAYMVLSLAARSADAIRQGFQDYLSQATGASAEITDLQNVSLVPDLSFRLKGVVLRDAQNKDRTMAKAGDVYIAIPLWRMMTGGRWYKGFEIKNLELASGFFLPRKLIIDYAGISNSAGGSSVPNFMASGIYNERELLVTAELARKERKSGDLYGFRNIFPMTLKLGDIEGHGFYVREWNGVNLEDVVLSRGAHQARFKVEGIDARPLAATMEGVLDDVGFTARFEMREDKTVLIVTPQQGREKFTAFARALENDLGLEPGNEIFGIEIEEVQTP